MSPWITHVKQYAKTHNISYKDAFKKGFFNLQEKMCVWREGGCACVCVCVFVFVCVCVCACV